MRSNCTKYNYFIIVLMSFAVLSCSVPPVRVPLVYEYPISTRQFVKSTEGVIVIDDQRIDKSLDNFISPSVPDAIKGVLSRELIATGCMDGFLPGNSGDIRTLPVQIQVQLFEASVVVPSHDANGASMVVGGIVLGGLGIALAGNHDTDIVGKVQMRVHVHNVQSGAEREETWAGMNTIKFPAMYMDTPQMYSKALGGAVKDAMTHLASALARVGIYPN